MVFQRFIFRLRSYWWIVLPAFFFFAELTLQRFYPFNSAFFWLVAQKLPLAQAKLTSMACLRALSFYVLLAVLIEFVRVLCNGRIWFAALLFSIGHAASMRSLLGAFPAMAERFVLAPYLLGILIALLLLSRGIFYWTRPRVYPTTSWWKPAVATAVCVMILWPMGRQNWVRGKELASQANPSKGSFFLLSFDAVPSSLFYAATPLLTEKWGAQSIRFTEAYSPINATFASWMAVLSGKHPLRSEVDTLFPNPRLGNLRTTDLLPSKLSRTGYRTVFMTDCSTTSFMELAYGFQEVYQPQPGIRSCQSAAIASTHPLTALMSRKNGDNFLFPEINSFCSQFSRPESFFQQVEKKLTELKSSDTPFFLAVHSCLTHRDVQEQLPAADSPLRQPYRPDGLPNSPSKDRLLWSIRLADQFADRLLNVGYSNSKPLWTFLFSDHGVRIDRNGAELKLFSHAMGEPRNHFQYHVPLMVIPPTKHHREISTLTSLLDIHPTIVGLSGLDRQQLDGLNLLGTDTQKNRALVLVSSVPGVEPSTPREGWAKELDRGHYSQEGLFGFSIEQQNEMRKARSLALLKLPYRYIHRAHGGEELYDENLDPFHEMDLMMSLPKVAQQMKKQLCEFHAPGCVPMLFTLLR